MHDDFYNKGFNHRFRHILPFVNVGITLQCILKNGQFFFVILTQKTTSAKPFELRPVK